MLSFTTSGTVADFQTLLRSVQYSSTAPDPTNAGANITRSIQWVVHDGTEANASPPVTTVHLNAPPEISDPGNNAAFVFAENGGAIGIVSGSIQVNDDTTPNLTAATIVLTNAQTGDVMTVGDLTGLGVAANIDTSVGGQVTVTLTGVATPQNYEEALKRVLFNSTSENPATVQRAITISVSDGTLDSADETTTISVVSQNDAPVNAIPPTLDVEANHSLTIAGLSVNDVDAEGDVITTTLSVTHGVLAVGLAPSGANVSGSGAATVMLTGTVAQINATLGAANNVVYTPATDFFGAATLVVSTNDDGNNGLAGGVGIDTDQVTINVNTLVTGTSGPDSYDALPGNSRVDGLGGVDTVTFNFRLVDATIKYSGNQVVVDTASSHTVLTGVEKYVFTDGTVNNADGDALVDDLFYYSKYHDVWNVGADAEAHYHDIGWHEGRDPSAFFSTSFYRALYPDVKAAGLDPLVHFHQSGWQEGRIPSLTFDAGKYLAANPDVAGAHLDPLWHFLAVGAGEGRQPIAPTKLVTANGFDAVYYMLNNPDVAAAGIDPFWHFQNIGWKEGRDPNALFDTSGYLATYTDVTNAHINPLDHYNAAGWKEGRDPSIGFDTTSYLAAYPDVAAANINPLMHFLAFGQQEGRSAFADGVWG